MKITNKTKTVALCPSWYDGCVYEPRGVACCFPSAYGTVPIECRSCGWNPAVAALRKLAIRARIEAARPKQNEGR